MGYKRPGIPLCECHLVGRCASVRKCHGCVFVCDYGDSGFAKGV